MTVAPALVASEQRGDVVVGGRVGDRVGIAPDAPSGGDPVGQALAAAVAEASSASNEPVVGGEARRRDSREHLAECRWAGRSTAGGPTRTRAAARLAARAVDPLSPAVPPPQGNLRL
jgi:hypothetical protein